MAAAAEILRRRAARRGLLELTRYTKPDYAAGWHHELLCRFLDRFVAGDLRRGIINMPPQHGKSELASRRLPAKILGDNPDTRLIACSHTQDLASAMNRDVQRIMDSQEYRRLYPEVSLSDGNNRTASGAPLRNSEMFEIPGRAGYYKCAGVGGSIVGRGFDVGIIDDPIKKREEADSPASREAVWAWYNGDFLTRRGKDARILVIMTRWNEDDLVGRLLKTARDDPRADQWEVLTLPAIAEQGPTADDPRQVGEALWPERYPVEELAKTQAASPYEWYAQYQQQPRVQGSVEWPTDYFGPHLWFDDWPQDLVVKVQALDPSKSKDSKTGDYAANVSLGLDRGGKLWADAWLDRCDASRVVSHGIELFRAFQPQALAIETNQFLQLFAVLFAQASRHLGLALPLYGINNTVPKPVRIRTLGPYLARHELRVRNTPGGRMLVQQLREFPSGSHDDAPDALEMALRMILFLLGKAKGAGAPQIFHQGAA